MNAIIPVTDKIQRLPRHQQKIIVNIALRNEPVPVRVERLRGLRFCTDDVKFQVLKLNRMVSEELYQSLYDIYFGVAKEEQPDAPEPAESDKPGQDEHDPEPEQDEPVLPAPEPPQALLDGFTELSPEVITAKPEQTRAPDKKPRNRFTNAENEKFVRDYLGGVSRDGLAEIYGLTRKQVTKKIENLKKSGWMEEAKKINNEPTIQENKPIEEPKTHDQSREEKFNDIIASVDAGKRPELPEPDALPKAFTATGKGFITTDGGLKLDEEPILSLLRQTILQRGLAQFYGEIEICIRPTAPTGMMVAVED